MVEEEQEGHGHPEPHLVEAGDLATAGGPAEWCLVTPNAAPAGAKADARGAAAASTRATKEAGSCMATVLRGHKKDSAGGTGEERCSIYV